MIIKNEEQIKLEFGNGDISIAGGYSTYKKRCSIDPDIKTGFVIFENQEPRDIGSIGVTKTGEVELNDYPVVMTFTKKESIDVLIGELEKAKSYMD